MHDRDECCGSSPVIRVLLLAIIVVVGVSFLPIQASQPSAFADPAFARYYRRASDQGQALLWGSAPIVSLVEPFTGAPGNRRLVEYFDKGRMELAVDPAEDGGTGPRQRVTEGLLVREMATGSVQLGYDSFVQGEPAEISIFGTTGSIEGPTYADFANDAGTRAPDLTDDPTARFDRWMSADGTISQRTPPADIRPGDYAEETGHNVPEVFTAWFDSRPFGAVTALDALGYPISEPFWVESGKGERGLSLVQLFERRVVTYTPDLPEAERFSLTNTGRHYYRWRYGNDPDPATARQQRSVAPVADDTAGLTLPEGYRATALLRDAGEIIDIALAPNGRLAVLDTGGAVRLVDPANPDLTVEPLVDHLANPVALAYAGTDLYVVDDAGLHRYQDIDADGTVDVREDVIRIGYDRASVALAPGPDGALYLSGKPITTGGSRAEASSGSPRSLVRVGPVSVSESLAPVEIGEAGPILVDDAGAVWLVGSDDRLIQIAMPDASTRERLTLNSLGDDAVVDLLLYRPDGTSGDPATDLIGLVSGAEDDAGRIVRLQPAQSSPTSPVASPEPASRPGAIVDFVTGLDQPVAMATGFDGSLFVLDAGANTVYLIQPTS